MFLQKTCLQVILAGKWLLRHSSTWRKQQRRPLPSLLCDSYSMGCIVRGWHHHIYIRSEAPLTWCVHADMTLYICAVRHPWRGACTLTWPYTYAQWGAPDVVRARWHDLIHMRSEAPLTWCVHADMTLYICAVRHPWRGACTLTGRGVCATCASTTSPSSSPARAACLWPTVAPPAGKRSDLCNDHIQRLLH